EYLVAGGPLAKDQKIEIFVVQVQVETIGDLGNGTSQKVPVVIGKGPITVDILPPEVARSGIGLYRVPRGIDMGIDFGLALQQSDSRKTKAGLHRLRDLCPGNGKGTGLDSGPPG